MRHVVTFHHAANPARIAREIVEGQGDRDSAVMAFLADCLSEVVILGCEAFGDDDGREFVATGGFNTGRLYRAEGQRVFWAQRADGWIYFNDIDRMINGWFFADDMATPLPFGPRSDPLGFARWLMKKYDGGSYEWAPRGETTASNPQTDYDLDYGAALRL